MARPREFDTQTVLENAMHAFWAKGYEATSLDDLCEATQLSRSSLYAAFGDKQTLLLHALDRYIERGVRRTTEALAKRPIRPALKALLRQHIDEIVAGPGRRGCFVGNCTAELAPHSPEVLQRVRQGMARNEASFRSALVRAKAKGELSEKADVGALARFLISSLQGMRLVAKTNPERAMLNDIARVIVRCLDT